MRRFWGQVPACVVVAASLVTACKYSSPDVPGADAGSDGPPPLPDAGTCVEMSRQCFTSGNDTVLQTCSAAGAEPVIDTCVWGCIASPEAHCGQLDPSGGAVAIADLVPHAGDEQLLPIMIDAATDLFADTGEITGVRAAGPGIVDGIEYRLVNGVGIFRMKSLQVTAVLDVRGANAVALVGLDSITVSEEIDLTRCSDPVCPGGFPGGNPAQAGGGLAAGGTAGAGVNDDSSGGGGGAYAANGGRGGAGTTQVSVTGGSAFGDAEITTLIGGGGGGGGGNVGGRGGNGGGAIQLLSNGTISFTSAGRINAGGCGGRPGDDKRGGGGGGAGGAVLIEAPTIALAVDAVIAVNGGGGGGGDRISEGAKQGEDAKFSLAAAAGGPPGGNGGTGGDGGAGMTLIGANGQDDTNGGGGGGSVGWIRINTRSGTASLDPGALVSPIIVPGAPASVGTATVK